MLKAADGFKSFNQYCRWHLTAALVALITFSSLVASPIFASYNNDDDILGENQCHTDIFSWQIFFKLPANQQDELEQKDFIASASDQSFLDILKENVDYLLHHYLINDATFYNDYVSRILPIFTDESFRKLGEKVMRHHVFSDDTLKSSQALSMLGVFFRNNIADFVANIRPAIERAEAKEDHQKSGKIIRNSIMLQLMLIPTQTYMGDITAHVLINVFGQPANTFNAIDTYSKKKGPFSIFGRFSSETAGTLLNMELPKYEHYPPIIKVGLTGVFYYGLYGLDRLLEINTNPIQGLKRFADVENIASSLTSLGVVAVVLFNDKYDKYQIMNVNDDDFLEWEEIKEIFSFGLPVFFSYVSKTIANTANILTIGLIGANHLKVEKKYKFLFLFFEAGIAAGSRTSGHLIIDSISTNETLKEINHKMRLGIVLGIGMTLPYSFILFFPCCLPTNVDERLMARALALTNIIVSIERIAQNELFAFKREEQNWYKTAGDVSKIAIPVVGFVLFRHGMIERNVGNYIIIQTIAILPSIFTIISAWFYGL